MGRAEQVSQFNMFYCHLYFRQSPHIKGQRIQNPQIVGLLLPVYFLTYQSQERYTIIKYLKKIIHHHKVGGIRPNLSN